MKKLVIILALVGFAWMGSFAQNDNDVEQNISLCVYLPNDTDIPNAAMDYLKSKLNNLVTLQGNADLLICDRFILTAKIDVLSKDIIVGPPQKVSQNISITLQIGDVEENQLYASTSLSLVGVGTNLTKSYMEAFKNIDGKDKQIADFLTKGKKKIGDYYQNHCDAIYTEAVRLIKQQQYDQAIYRLAVIPNLETTCFEKCQTLMVDAYQQKINWEGRENLKKAQLLWTQNPDESGAQQAVQCLLNINVFADCQSEVQQLINEISSKMATDTEKEWRLALKQYNDQVQLERVAAQNDYELRKMQIRAAKEVSVAMANNRPDYIFYW